MQEERERLDAERKEREKEERERLDAERERERLDAERKEHERQSTVAEQGEDEVRSGHEEEHESEMDGDEEEEESEMEESEEENRGEGVLYQVHVVVENTTDEDSTVPVLDDNDERERELLE